MIIVRCKDCGTEVTSQSRSCGCPNMVRVNGEVITAIDLTRTVMVNYDQANEKTALTAEDLAYQEKRRQHKVRKLNFETR